MRSRSIFTGSVEAEDPQKPAEPGHVGVDSYARIRVRRIGLGMRVGKDDVGGLAGHARKGEEFGHGRRNLAAVVGQDLLRRPDYVLGLVAEEPGGVDVDLELRHRGACVVLDGPVLLEGQGITWFTILSVLWAERTTDTSNSQSFPKSRTI